MNNAELSIIFCQVAETRFPIQIFPMIEERTQGGQGFDGDGEGMDLHTSCDNILSCLKKADMILDSAACNGLSFFISEGVTILVVLFDFEIWSKT